jgi:hypothetical protein
MMNRRQTTTMAVVSLLATMITVSSPTPALAHGHWNPDGDFSIQPESESGSDEMQRRPLTLDKILPAESAVASSNTGEGQHPVASEKIQMIPIPEEVCGDGIDNDGDALIDLSDERCSAMEPQQQQQQQQQPILQQEPVVVSGAEICEDDLDNDFDGKVDSRDDECSYITGSTSDFSIPGQSEPESDEETEIEDEEDEQKQSDEDLNEESEGNENSDGKDDNNSNDDEQDEDEEREQQSEDEGNDDDEDDDDEDDDEQDDS